MMSPVARSSLADNFLHLVPGSVNPWLPLVRPKRRRPWPVIQLHSRAASLQGAVTNRAF